MPSLEYWQTNKSFDTFTILNDWWGFLFVVFRVLVFVDSTQFYFLDRMKGFPDKETDLDSRPQSTCRHMLYVESFHLIFHLFPTGWVHHPGRGRGCYAGHVRDEGRWVHVMPCHVMSCLFIPCHVMCHVHVMSWYPLLSRHGWRPVPAGPGLRLGQRGSLHGRQVPQQPRWVYLNMDETKELIFFLFLFFSLILPISTLLQWLPFPTLTVRGYTLRSKLETRAWATSRLLQVRLNFSFCNRASNEC